MSTREEAQELLGKLYSCMPTAFYNKLEAAHRGFGFVLSYLEQARGEVIAGDIAKKLNVSTARIAVLLKKMEQSGYITRRNSAKDARRTVVEITPAGVELIDEMREQTLKKVALLLDRVGKKDIDTYLRISSQIRELMDE